MVLYSSENSGQGTRSVLYLELRPEQNSLLKHLRPRGRGFKSTRLTNPLGPDRDNGVPISCTISLDNCNRQSATPPPNRIISFEQPPTILTSIWSIQSDGYAVLGPAKTPPLISTFRQRALALKTSCRALTDLCGWCSFPPMAMTHRALATSTSYATSQSQG